MNTNWPEKFNALPDEIRIIGSACETRTRIQHLNMEKDRLKRGYNRNIKEINSHIKNCEDYLNKLDKTVTNSPNIL